MQAPASLTTLLAIARRRVSELERQFEVATTRATRTESSLDQSRCWILDAELSRAKSRLAALKLQLRRESREDSIGQ